MQKNKWYILKTRNTYERKVAERVESYHTKDVYIRCLIPTEKIADTSSGTLKFKEKLTYPGYVFIETNSLHGLLTEIKFIDGSQGFVKERDGTISTMSERHLDRLFSLMEENEKREEVLSFNVGDKVKITNGAFDGFDGKILEIDNLKYDIEIELMKFKTKISVSFGEFNHLD